MIILSVYSSAIFFLYSSILTGRDFTIPVSFQAGVYQAAIDTEESPYSAFIFLNEGIYVKDTGGIDVMAALSRIKL